MVDFQKTGKTNGSMFFIGPFQIVSTLLLVQVFVSLKNNKHPYGYIILTLIKTVEFLKWNNPHSIFGTVHYHF